MLFRPDTKDKIYADGGYRGVLVQNVKSKFGWDMEITLRNDTAKGFTPLPSGDSL
jgi:hypothetical protein